MILHISQKQLSTNCKYSTIFKTLNGELTVFNKTLITTKDYLKALETVDATVYNKNGAFNLQGLSVNTSQSVSNFTKLNNAFKAYNGNLTKSTQLQTAYIKAVGNQNSSLGNYLAGLNGAKASMGGYIKSLIGAKAATIGLQVASTLLNTAISMGLSLAINALVSAISNWINKEKEAREEAIENAKAAKEESNNLTELLNKYNQLSKEVQSNQGVKEDLLEVQSDLLEALGIEASQIDSLIEKYGDLDSAINQVTLDSLRDAQGDLMTAVDAYEGDLIDIGKGYTHWYSLFDRNILSGGQDSVQAFNILENAGVISSGSHGTGGGSLVLTGDDKTVEGILENYQKLKDAQEALNTAIDNGEVTMEEMAANPLYQAINKRLDELDKSIGNYNTAVDDLNKNVAQQQILKSLSEQSSIPETQEEFETFKQSMIDTAIASTKFVGSQDDIRDSIINVLSTMPEFEKFFEEIKFESGTFNNETNIFSLSTSEVESIETYQKNIKTLSDALSDLNDLETTDIASLMTEFSSYSSVFEKFGVTGVKGVGDLQGALIEIAETMRDTATKAVPQMTDAITNMFKAISNPKGDIYEARTELNALMELYNSISDSQSMDMQTATSLINKYPKLASAVQKVGEEYSFELGVVRDLVNEKIEYINTVSSYEYDSVIQELETIKQQRETYERKIEAYKDAYEQAHAVVYGQAYKTVLEGMHINVDDYIMQDSTYRSMLSNLEYLDSRTEYLNGLLEELKEGFSMEELEDTSSNDFEQQIDWAAQSVSNLSEKVSDLETVLDNTKGWEAQLEAIQDVIGAQKDLQEGYRKSRDLYLDEYNKALTSGVLAEQGLSSSIKNKIESGSLFNIQDFIDENVAKGTDKGTQEQIYDAVQEAMDWYEKYVDADNNYIDIGFQIDDNELEKLNAEYESEVSLLQKIGTEIGTNSTEYREQLKVVNECADGISEYWFIRDRKTKSTSLFRKMLKSDYLCFCFANIKQECRLFP